MSVNLKPLTTPLFLACLFLLLLNDFYLKTAFHNSLTGKLSDICGLFIFPILWSVIFSGRKHVIYILTALFFTYWKSRYSEPFIDLFSQYVFPVQRTIDPTDLFALIVLPLSWYFLSIPQKGSFFNPHVAGLIAFFSFCASNVEKPSQHFDQPQYVLFQSSAYLTDSTLTDKGLKIYNLDHLLAVRADWVGLHREPVKYDDFNKNLVLKNLTQLVLAELPGKYNVIPDEQVNQLTIKTKDYQDYLIFRGSHLHGKFLRKDQDQILIDGQFKNGIEDSVWTFHNPSGYTTTKKTFKKGEAISIGEFADSKLMSSKSINTRNETRIFKGFQLVLILALCILIIRRLIKTHRTVFPDTPDMKIVYKCLLSISLPFLTCLMQLMIWMVIPDHYANIFYEIFSLFWIYVIGIPFFIILLFGVKPKKKIDLVWYSVLLVLLFSLWHETITLSLLLEN